MRLLEYEAKELFQQYGVPIPRGAIAMNVGEAVEKAKEIGTPVVLKSQIPVGGRGKAGLIQKARDLDDVGQKALSLFGRRVGQYVVDKILIEEFSPHEGELYMSLFLDRGERRFSFILSREGGVEVESVKDKVIIGFDHWDFNDEVIEQGWRYLNLDKGLRDKFYSLAKNMHKLSESTEAELVEINPLVFSKDGFKALDAKIIIDDNALFRHKGLERYSKKTELEKLADTYGFSFVPLEGEVAVVGNGAGLVLSSLDLVTYKGLRPACFLDVGGGAPADRVYAALKVVSEIRDLRAIFMNIFGGITNCVEVAKGVIKARDDEIIKVPLILRIAGTAEEKARKILKDEGVHSHIEVEEALKALEGIKV